MNPPPARFPYRPPAPAPAPQPQPWLPFQQQPPAAPPLSLLQNPNPDFIFPQQPQVREQLQRPFPFQPQLPSPPPPSRDLKTILSHLKALISISEQTLDSLSKTLDLDPNTLLNKTKSFDLARCPFNPQHLMPPESLFHHVLRCPPKVDFTYLIETLDYPKTLNPSKELPKKPSLVGAATDLVSDELSFSLDEYEINDFVSNFFYKDCPGCIIFPGTYRTKKVLKLPVVLLNECADSYDVDEQEASFEGILGVKVLPSELRVTRTEIDAWIEYPTTYSINVLCTFLGSEMVGQSTGLRKWIIASSPKHGVIIDTYMRDHIFVLFRLCLKAIVKEACAKVEFVANACGDSSKQNGRNGQKLSFRDRRFECPVLVDVLKWLASQLEILYGEANGKLFATNMIRQWILEATSRLFMFRTEENMVDETPRLAEVSEGFGSTSTDLKDVKCEEQPETSAECESGRKSEVPVVDDDVIYVSQIAAAVAALHECSVLEQKLRSLRFAQPLRRHQRFLDHDSMSKKADEERKSRPDYRPIVESFGLPRKQSPVKQEPGQPKTRAQLLAEQRDYKRRRMSYRGKRVKRTPLQILRGIIEAYTEEMKRANGIGDDEKEPEKETMLPPKPPLLSKRKEMLHDQKEEAEKETMLLPESPLPPDRKEMQHDEKKEAENHTIVVPGPPLPPDRKETRSDQKTTSTVTDDALPKANKRPKWDHSGDHEHSRDSRRSNDSKKRHKEDDSRSSSKRKSHRNSYDRGDRDKELDDIECSRTQHHSDKNFSYDYDHMTSYSRRDSSDDRRQRSTYDDRSTKSRRRGELDDRHDRSASRRGRESDGRYGHSESQRQRESDDKYDRWESRRCSESDDRNHHSESNDVCG